jgi:8-oxo-dGTP diphosphatase
VSPAPVIGVAVAVVSRMGPTGQREFLVGRRAFDAVDGPGLDEFPGGKVEPGETPQETAARECLEEAGLVVSVGEVLDRAQGTCKAGPIDVWFFAASPSGEAIPTSPFDWVPQASLGGLRFPETNRRVLAALLTRQGGS